MTIRAALSALLLAAAPLAAVTLAPVAVAQPGPTLAGDWQGAYVASTGGDANTFTVKLRQNGAVISGTIVETNAFGDRATALFLTSTFRGEVSGADVKFLKTYDGSGGVSHAVWYNGRLEPNGRRIRGSYDADGATGTFEMVR